jgi:hypothetical protein
MMKHPIERLSLFGDGGLSIKDASGSREPYMGTLPVSVVAKQDFKQTTGTFCRFYFKLNEAPCPVWQQIFQTNLNDGTIGLDGEELSFECFPADLQSRFARTKGAITRTNADFAAERERLVTELRERARQETERVKKREEARKQIGEQFNALEL